MRAYPLLNSLVVPRPIAWVSTRSPEGVDNLAPHSYFTVSSVVPAVVQFTSVGTKDTLRNVLATGEFTVSLCTEQLADAVNTTGTDYPPGTSEFDAAGLVREPSRLVAPPRVAASPAALECRLLDTRSFGEAVVVFGQVVWIEVDEDALTGGRPDIARLRPISRLGGNEYGAIGAVTEHRRVPYEQLAR